ncbi:MAG TPA: PIN domain-containing protein [Candidatus Obscuribacterales bacterium]
MANSLFVDTSGWASLFINTQPHHRQAEHYFRQALQHHQGLITTNYILTELVALLHSPLRIPRFRIFDVVDGIKAATYVQVIYIDKAIDSAAWGLCKSRADKNWSLVDCSSFIVMQQLGLQEALTTDHHFE